MKETARVLEQALKQGRKSLLETEAKTLCREYSIPVTRFELARNEADAVKYANEIGYPIVLKIVSADIIHKSDVGGVVVDLGSADDVRHAYNQILVNVKKHYVKARMVGILVQEMAPPATEVIVGAIKAPQFGSAVMFGLGGIFVEVLKDVTFRVVPITEDEASEMITEVKAYPLLKGYRNIPPADTKAIEKKRGGRLGGGGGGVGGWGGCV